MALRPTNPHFNLPFRLSPGGADVVEQDTVDDVANCVQMIVETHVGYRLEAPTFGIPDLTFRTIPVGRDELAGMIISQEPRAQVFVQEWIDLVDNMIDRLNVEVSTKGGSV
jgi:hypothetical protein